MWKSYGWMDYKVSVFWTNKGHRVIKISLTIYSHDYSIYFYLIKLMLYYQPQYFKFLLFNKYVKHKEFDVKTRQILMYFSFLMAY